MMKQSIRTRHGEAGVALMIALGLLVFFLLLGMAFATFMAIQYDSDTKLGLGRTQNRNAAQSGVFAAVGELQKALTQGKSAPVGTREFTFPVYMPESRATLGLAPSPSGEKAIVTILDECARINLNYAPTRVLESILGVDAGTARKIRASLPRQEGEVLGEAPAVADRRWLYHPDELVTRGLVDASTYDMVDKSLLTVYTVADPNNPTGFINVNSAPAQVIAALLNITPEAAQGVVAARPISSLAQLSAAAKQDPAAFNVKPAPDAPGALPKELSFTSHCFRIISEVTRVGRLSEVRVAARAEAAVNFSETGKPEIRFWTEEYAETPETGASAQAAPTTVVPTSQPGAASAGQAENT